MKTILTGLRVGSELTLGNFLGALLPMVRLSNKHSDEMQINIFVPDLHSILGPVDKNIQKNAILSMKYYLAAGLKINKNVHIYRQSYVPAHSEMCWLLNSIATTGELSRMTQFKDKSEGKTSVQAGMFEYPILMAADILLYSANYVPVGEDQFQHIELTRDIAIRTNKRFGEIFTVPEKTIDQVKFMELDNGIRIRDLVDPQKKMSKSSRSENGKIMLTDAPEVATKKIMSATTDSYAKVRYDMFKQPGVSNLMQIAALVNDTPLQDVVATWAGETHYGDLKKQVASFVSTFLADIQDKIASISDDTILKLFEEGEIYANDVADRKLYELQKALGLR